MTGPKGEMGQKGSKGDSGGREGVSLLYSSVHRCLFMLIEGYYVFYLVGFRVILMLTIGL